MYFLLKYWHFFSASIHVSLILYYIVQLCSMIRERKIRVCAKTQFYQVIWENLLNGSHICGFSNIVLSVFGQWILRIWVQKRNVFNYQYFWHHFHIVNEIMHYPLECYSATVSEWDTIEKWQKEKKSGKSAAGPLTSPLGFFSCTGVASNVHAPGEKNFYIPKTAAECSRWMAGTYIAF